MLPSFGEVFFFFSLSSGNEKEMISLLCTELQMSTLWCNGKAFCWELVLLAPSSCVKKVTSLLDPFWPWAFSLSVALYEAYLNSLSVSWGGGMFYKGNKQKKIRLLVTLCCILFVNRTVKHKVKLKQIQAVCWKSKRGLSQSLGILCLCLWMGGIQSVLFWMSLLS